MESITLAKLIAMGIIKQAFLIDYYNYKKYNYCQIKRKLLQYLQNTHMGKFEFYAFDLNIE